MTQEVLIISVLGLFGVYKLSQQSHHTPEGSK